jgi:hypothetical protein
MVSLSVHYLCWRSSGIGTAKRAQTRKIMVENEVLGQNRYVTLTVISVNNELGSWTTHLCPLLLLNALVPSES